MDRPDDSRGWRNSSALSHADIVVFGDSQTYGLNVSRDEAWPQRVGHLLHRSVYQMAYGGYGPAHYVLLLDEAFALRPKIILAAYYFGNDDYDILKAIQWITTAASDGTEFGDYGAPLCIHYRDQRLSTVFNAGYRLFALDNTDPRISEGERISLLALKHVADRCRQVGIRFYVIAIPTKETAFRRQVEGSLNGQRYLVSLWNSEARARTEAFDFITRQGIWMIDTLPALEAVIAAGVNPYMKNADGHPVQPGYNAIALAVADRLKQDGLALR